MINILDTGVKRSKNVDNFIFGEGSLGELESLLLEQKKARNDYVIYFVDEYFINSEILNSLPVSHMDQLIYVETKHEPTTQYIDKIRDEIMQSLATFYNPAAVVGMGGGITMDVAKAISNLLTNGGKAKDYQGWDLVKKPGIYKIGIPTISGTGAEATRTCVMTNKENGLKLGMNSDKTVFNEVILDPTLSKTVPRDQYFYTGMDAYIHCVEALNGSYRNAIGDTYSKMSIDLCKEVFFDKDMMSDTNREKLMIASYLGGCAIATTYVGVVHPFSAGLSVVLDTHHCISNCIVLNVLGEFYPEQHIEFKEMLEKQNITLPKGLCANLTKDEYDSLYEATIIHEKPLYNALGKEFREILNKEKVIEIFKSI